MFAGNPHSTSSNKGSFHSESSQYHMKSCLDPLLQTSHIYLNNLFIACLKLYAKCFRLSKSTEHDLTDFDLQHKAYLKKVSDKGIQVLYCDKNYSGPDKEVCCFIFPLSVFSCIKINSKPKPNTTVHAMLWIKLNIIQINKRLDFTMHSCLFIYHYNKSFGNFPNLIKTLEAINSSIKGLSIRINSTDLGF